MIKIYKNTEKLSFKNWKFPGKEIGVQLENIDTDSRYVIHLLNPDSEELFTFFNILDALRHKQVKKENIEIYLPYVPYGRQDRVCHDGESLALGVFANTFKANAYWSTLVIEDPHSPATVAYLQSGHYYLEVFNQGTCADTLPTFDYLIAPDKGAAGKLSFHRDIYNGHAIPIVMDKERIDGLVKHVPLHDNIIVGSACIVDDICDGGATFLSVGNMLRKNQPRMTELNLYVTHGLFSKGTDELNQLFDNIYTANNYNTSVTNVKVI